MRQHSDFFLQIFYVYASTKITDIIELLVSCPPITNICSTSIINLALSIWGSYARRSILCICNKYSILSDVIYQLTNRILTFSHFDMHLISKDVLPLLLIIMIHIYCEYKGKKDKARQDKTRQYKLKQRVIFRSNRLKLYAFFKLFLINTTTKL